MLNESKLTICKNGYIIRLHNRRIEVRRMENGNWFFAFYAFFKGSVIEDHYNKVISRGDKHICVTYLALSNESWLHILASYSEFLRYIKTP